MECIVAIDGRFAALLRFRDEPRSDSTTFVQHLGNIPADNPNTKTINEPKYYQDEGYLLSEKVGVAGVEKTYEDVLHGTPGKRVYEVDANGRVLGVVEEIPPTNGEDIQLSSGRKWCSTQKLKSKPTSSPAPRRKVK